MAFLLRAMVNVVTSPVEDTPQMTSSAEAVVCELSSSLAVVLVVRRKSFVSACMVFGMFRLLNGSWKARFAKIGAGLASLARKITGVHSPEEMESSCEAALAATRARREPLLGHHEELFREISAKKKAWQRAPAARKRLLEMELRTLLAEYRGEERQLSTLFENERTLVTVLGGLREVSAYGMRKISGRQIDGLSEKLEDATGEADALADAMDDLGKAGKRREAPGETESLEEALAGFGDGSVEELERPPAGTEREPSGGEGETSGVRQAVSQADAIPPAAAEADT